MTIRNVNTGKVLTLWLLAASGITLQYGFSGCAEDDSTPTPENTETPTSTPAGSEESSLDTEALDALVEHLSPQLPVSSSVTAWCLPSKQKTWYFDNDKDAHGNPTVTYKACTQPTGYVSVGDDCNDSDGTIYPGALEKCDGKDQDCDGVPDDGLTQSTWYKDSDGDGYGVCSSSTISCAQPSGYSGKCNDCNDSNASVSPGKSEVSCDGIDNNCDGTSSCSATASVSGSLYILDDDAWPLEDQSGSKSLSGSVGLTYSGDCDTVLNSSYCVGGEVNVVYTIKACLSEASGGQVTFTTDAKLYEYTSCGTTDLGDSGSWTASTKIGATSSQAYSLNNQEDDGYAKLSLTFSAK